MKAVTDQVLLRVLRACADAAPFFPADHHDSDLGLSDLGRDTVDAALDRLRLAGLVQIADWVQGKGQGYMVTPAGADSLHKQRIVPAPAAEELPTPAIETPWERGEQARLALFEPRPPVVSLALIFVNLAVAAVGVGVAVHYGLSPADYLFNRNNAPFYNATMVSLPHVVQLQQYWRLLSYQFVHAGLLHLALNMFALFTLGRILESLWGHTRFLALYLIAGWVGGCAVLLTNSLAVGASGAICGLLISMGVWTWLHRAHLPPELLAAVARDVAINVMIMVWISTMPNVSWQGHLGGAIGGALASVPLFWLGRVGWPRRLAGLLGTLAIPALALAAGLAPHWQIVRARWNWQPPNQEANIGKVFEASLGTTETWLTQQYQRYAAPLVNPGPAPWQTDDRYLPAARKMCETALAQLKGLMHQIEALTPRHPSDLTREMHETRAYLSAWHDFFMQMKLALERPHAWHAGRRGHLRPLLERVYELHAPLERHNLMPRLDPLPPMDRNPPPPNTA